MYKQKAREVLSLFTKSFLCAKGGQIEHLFQAAILIFLLMIINLVNKTNNDHKTP